MQTLSLNRMKKFNPWIFGILIAGTLGSVATVYWKTQETSPQPDLTSQTVLVQTKDWVAQIQANGVVQALQKINLNPEDSGRITKLYVNEGDRVQKGQIIARMNSERLQAQVNQYQASLDKAVADLKQKVSGTRQEEIAESRARVATAEASVAASQTRLNRAIAEMQRNQVLVQAGAISRNAFEEFVAKEQEARANLEAERARLKEQRESLNKAKNGLRPEEITQGEAEVAQAKAQLAFYQSQLNNAVIRAPFAGIITRRFAQEGDFVTPTTSASTTEGATSASIAELSSGLEIEARIPEASIAKINRGQLVDIQTDTYSNETFKGKVNLIAPRAVQENNVTSFRVKVALSSGQDKLKSGMNVRLIFHSQTIKNALVIPLAAVATQPNGQTGVYIPDTQNAARFQPVKVRATSGDQVQILSGLQKGDRVLISPPSTEKIEGVDKVEF
ncbi:efflux RND transporter periplasmic adaptor subunit [Nostoc sp. MG11]|uniref:efflux RND transporter periplasmic adaptor subunit n=1 Tax=Nostoc sp. MG11 TaxID=2721166 RepID=UPI0018692AA0|nr:efflux RND transporter periplasmic adaptor subunit [Nostoc sp. MG11]